MLWSAAQFTVSLLSYAVRESTKMVEMTGIVKLLTKERNQVARQLSGLNAAIAAFAGSYTGTKPTRKISAAGRKRIAAAQRARWAKIRAKKG